MASPRATTRRLILGFRDYDANCVACHGAPGQDRAPWASRMSPAPPDFTQGRPNLNTRAVFMAICRGVGLSGMPAWRAHRSDDQIWNIVLFLRAMPSIRPEAYLAMRNAYGPAPDSFALTPDALCLTGK